MKQLKLPFLIWCSFLFLFSSCSDDNESTPITDLNFNVPSLELYVGESKQVSVKSSPEGNIPKGLVWSTPENFISVTNDGVVTGLRQGYTTLTVATNDTKVSKTIVVKVMSPISFDAESYSLNKGDNVKLILNYLSDDLKGKPLIWNSSDTSIASVSIDGIVTAIKSGTVTVTVKDSENRYEAKCSIVVFVSVESVVLNVTDLRLPKGKSFQLEATILPEDAENKNVNWKTSDSSVVLVDDNGLIQGIKLGSATITATTEDGQLTASCGVEVTATENIEYTPYGEEIKW
ncbi:MAG: Ig-like domain-containing protein [Bacteroidaceae bacterium]